VLVWIRRTAAEYRQANQDPKYTGGWSAHNFVKWLNGRPSAGKSQMSLNQTKRLEEQLDASFAEEYR
jgi:hypothetical protein